VKLRSHLLLLSIATAAPVAPERLRQVMAGLQ